MVSAQEFRCLIVYRDVQDAEQIKKSILSLEDTLSVDMVSAQKGLDLSVCYSHLVVIGLEEADAYISVLEQSEKAGKKKPCTTLIMEEAHAQRSSQFFMKGANFILYMPYCDQAIDAVFLSDLLHNREVKDLKDQLRSATQTAFDAMTASSEVGQVLAFVERALSCRSYEDIADRLFELGDHLGLHFFLWIQIAGQEHSYAHNQDCSKSLFSIIDTSKSISRLYSKGNISVYHHQHVSVLIKNMPEENQHRCGVIRDLLAQIANTIDACVKTITFEHLLRKQSHSALQTVKHIRDISEDNKENLGRVLDTLLNDMKRSVDVVNENNKVDNVHLDTAIQSCIEEMEHMHVNSVELEKKFVNTLSGFKDVFEIMRNNNMQ